MRKKASSRKKTDPIITALARHKLLSYSELTNYGATGIKLRRMTEAGLVIQLGSGIYASPELDPFVASVQAIAKYYPKATISGFTALQIHGLAQEYVERIDVDVPRETSIRNKMLKAHRVPKSRLIGITELKFHGRRIRIYDRERTLCEAFRLDPAGPLFFKALKRYIAKDVINTEKVQLYDKALKTRVLMHIQQELADG